MAAETAVPIPGDGRLCRSWDCLLEPGAAHGRAAPAAVELDDPELVSAAVLGPTTGASAGGACLRMPAVAVAPTVSGITSV